MALAAGPQQLPYRAEYAKSGRAACRTCKDVICQGVLRLAVMVQSPHFDGKMPFWHHSTCFFLKQKPKSVGDIAHFDSLRWEDQESIREKIANASGESSKKGKKNTRTDLKDYKVEYAVSGGSKCIACEEKIKKNEVRVGKMDYESETALKYGALFRWHHVDCFVKVREAIAFTESGTKIQGYKDLYKEDQDMIIQKVPTIASGKRKNEEAENSVAEKRIKTETVVKESPAELKLKNLAKAQNKKMFKFRDRLEKQLSKPDLVNMMEFNKQEIPVGVDRILDRLSDVMTFGVLLPCKVCKTGQYVYSGGFGYQCMGYLTEYTKCGVFSNNPERAVFKVPEEYKEIFSDKFMIAKRVILSEAPTARPSEMTSFVKLNAKPLKDLKICFIGDDELSKSENWKNLIATFGGIVRVRVSATNSIHLVIATEDNIDTVDEKLFHLCRKRKIPIVSKKFVTRLKETMIVSEEIKKCLLPACDWIKPNEIIEMLRGANPEFEKKEIKSKQDRAFELRGEGKVRLKMKGGAVVDPDSGMEDCGHVYKDGSTVYNAVLNKTDVDTGTNSFYKLQIIESDRKSKHGGYWIFRAWGRIGTTIGGLLLSEETSRDEALDVFNNIYTKQTKNTFGGKFVKQPGGYLPMDIDYGDEATLAKLVPSNTESKLHLSIQELICLIFDVDNMKSALLEFELDLEKMPLGKLSRKQILKAYTVLSEALEILKSSSDKPAFERLMVDASNRFYTLIPHNFGTSLPITLNDDTALKGKLAMLESLMEIELAYELLCEEGADKATGGSQVDRSYAKLKTDLSVLEAKSKEFGVIKKYLANTHASTHDLYDLDIEQIFKVVRKSEVKRFEEFSKMDNRKLLWHGSRTTNYVGILSQGLRIAPPEAPSTGYMFGKGIYFADMVSKSANYCFTSASRTTGLLLLCEVALGKMYEVKSADGNLLKAPKDHNSVKGLGQTHPDPKEKISFSNGVEVPYGKPVSSNISQSELLYNEYVVYDPGQVKIRYLLKCNFVYKDRRRR